MSDGTSRRDFLKTAALSGAALGAAGAASPALGADSAVTPPEAAKVPRRTLGRTGESVPILLMGCAQKFDPKYDKLLHRAYADGVDYLDTALGYADGMSQKTIAPFLKQIGDRKKVWITSKGEGAGTPESFRKQVDECLAGLDTDYLDLFFMHAIDDVKLLEPDFLKLGDDLKKAKKTRYFGFSCHDGNVVALLDKAARVGGIDVIMFRYSFAQYGDLALNKAMDACHKAGIGLIAMKTQRSVPDEVEKVAGFKSKNFTLAQAKLKAVWTDERLAAAVSHMDNTTKLKENVDAAKSPVQLSMDEFRQLQRIATAGASYACSGCNHVCESRIAAPVKVAATLRYLMYAECYGDAVTACTLYGRLPSASRDFDGIDFSAASAVCPQGIDIAARLQRARDILTA
jgi:predicted aldo/keto reductase-like oxidoreductase